jgi:peroxiredoxin
MAGLSGFSQSVPPSYGPIKLGAPMPDFVLTQIEHFRTSSASLKDFKGRWLVLDFWHEYCSGCIAAFPKDNALQNNFKDTLQFMLVGFSGSEYVGRSSRNSIRILYEKVRARENLDLAVAYDSVLFKRLMNNGFPFIVIIDPEGTVRGLANSLSETDTRQLITGEVKFINQKPDPVNIDYNYKTPFLINGNGGNDTDFLFRSMLAKWRPGDPYYNPVAIRNNIQGKFEVLKMSLPDLYRLAYTGEFRWDCDDSLYGTFEMKPVLLMDDTLLFYPDYIKGLRYFSYSLMVPERIADPGRMMAIMQRDLRSYFGYEGSIKKKLMPCWKITADPGAWEKLKAKGDSTYATIFPRRGVFAKNYSLRSLIRMIWADNEREPPFIDETGFPGNIDITLDCLMIDLKDVDEALKKNGLHLVRGEKEMSVLVISNMGDDPRAVYGD